MKIKTKNPNNVSMNLIVPIDGLINIDSEGIADVTAKCAVELVNNTNDWLFLKKSDSEEKTAKEDKNKKDSKEDKNKKDSKEDEKRKFLEEQLKSLSVEQMKEMAKEGGMDELEYEKLNTEKEMNDYILKKFDKSF